MGEVYRARDTRLGRDVAVKVLPEQFSKDPDRLRRFEQEARATGVLNHPNILAIYDVGTNEGAPYIVSELLDGETLRDALDRGAIGLKRAIDYAAQIASGLAAAHDKGLVHRDLKPENVFITRDGRVKVLDFGLAKLTEASSGSRSELPTLASEPGVALGTVGYMPPEQVRGQSVDHRADIFSLGAVLYEMLSGARAFHRGSAVETMSAILKEEPADLQSQRGDMPPALERIVRRCLEKPPARRFQSASDLGFALETLSTPSAPAVAVTATLETRHFSSRFRTTAAALRVGAVGAIAALGIGVLLRKPPEQPSPAWNGSLLVGGSTIAFGPRVSPDGRTVAFQVSVDGLTQVAVLQVNSGDWENRTFDRSAGYTRNVAWSNDGAKIYYDRVYGNHDRVLSVPAVGGPERLILEDATMAESLSDGSLLINRSIAGRYQLHRFWPDTNKLESLPAFPIVALSAPVRALPGGSHVVFYGYGEAPDSAAATVAHLYSLDLTTNSVTRLAPNLALPAPAEYTASLFTSALALSDRKTALLSVPSGELHRIVAIPLDGGPSVRTLLTVTAPPLFLDAGPDGSIYMDQVDSRLEAVRTTVNGAPVQPLVKSTIPPQYCSGVLYLPDGRVLFPTQFSGRARLLVTSERKEPKPFADTTEESSPPIAQAGSDQIAFLLGRSPNQVIGLASAADGRITRRVDLPGGTQISCLASSADGKTIYYIANRTLWTLPATGGQPRKLARADAVALNPRTGEIVVQRNETGGTHFFRFDAVNGREQRIEIRTAEAPPSSGPLSSAAIAPDSRIVLPIAPPDSWDWEIGLLDPVSLSLKRVPMEYRGGLNSPGWTSDGRIVFAGAPIQSSIWRFRPE